MHIASDFWMFLNRCCISVFVVAVLFTAGCVAPASLKKAIPESPAAALEPVDWAQVSSWEQADLESSLEVFLKSCPSLRFRPEWQRVCEKAKLVDATSSENVRSFFQTNFELNRVQKADGDTSGLVTGYYVPDLAGSRVPDETYAYPLYGIPDDLLTIDLRSVYPELSDYRLRGRLEGRRVVPYYDRSEIDGSGKPLQGNELCWVSDPVELFFLHIQGSGRILLNDGRQVMVHYANQNGHPYRSIGRLLLDRGEMTRDQMSMQNIRAWARQNPEAAKKLLAENPSYVFFEELSQDVQSPPGALGVPLTPGRSLAVDPRTVPLGAPVLMETTWPTSAEPLVRLMVAQDTGGAIKGRVRADFFWGMGDEAGELAGRMKQVGRMWVLLPKPSADDQAQVQVPE